MPTTQFLEADYLANNPDVAAAVARGEFASGWDHFQKCGRLEGRVHRDPRAMTRVDKALYGVNRAGPGLEIGPSHNPIAPKKHGFNVHILDHMSAENLRTKYAGQASLGVNVDNIEDVDFVWSGLPLGQTVGAESCYDWIIASHVIEHVPDLISFLQQCDALLKPQGRLSLVVPDKRYCFDHLNETTFTGELLDAFAARRTRPPPGKVFDHYSNACKLDGSIAWDVSSVGELRLAHSQAHARELWQRAGAGAGYIDVHCWRFTPPSFHLVLHDLQSLGLCRLGVISQFPTAGSEFYMSLGKLDESELRGVDRLAALQAIQQAG